MRDGPATPHRVAVVTIFEHHWRVIDRVNGRRLAGFTTKPEADHYWASLPHPELAEVIEFNPERMDDA